MIKPLTSPPDRVEELVSINETGSETDSILWIYSPDQTSETLKVSDPFKLSVLIARPKQKDFPTKSRIGWGRISGSSICYKY